MTSDTIAATSGRGKLIARSMPPTLSAGGRGPDRRCPSRSWIGDVEPQIGATLRSPFASRPRQRGCRFCRCGRACTDRFHHNKYKRAPRDHLPSPRELLAVPAPLSRCRRSPQFTKPTFSALPSSAACRRRTICPPAQKLIVTCNGCPE